MLPSEFVDTMTLADARAALRGVVDDGARCPCCTQLAKVYRRKVHAGMAYALVVMWNHSRGGWLYKPDVLRGVGASARDESLLRYWGLIEPDPADGRNGWWRVTPTGGLWVTEQTTIPKYARVYDGRCLELVGPPITIRDALGSRFDYAELMGAQTTTKGTR